MSRAFAHAGVGREPEVGLAENLYAITVDPQQALEEWLGRQLGGGALKRLLTRSRAFQYFVAAAPGAKELITIAKVWELAQGERWDKPNRTYDLVIVDAPASGHGLAMLQTPQTFGEIARVGPIQRQADKVATCSPTPRRTGYVAVALPEEMPVNETLELGEPVEARSASASTRSSSTACTPSATRDEADALRAAARRRPRPGGPAAIRAALTAARAARASEARTCAACAARPARPCSTLPFAVRARGRAGRVRAPGRGADGGAEGLDAVTIEPAVTPEPARRLSDTARWLWRVQGLIATVVALFARRRAVRRAGRRAVGSAADRRVRGRRGRDPGAALVALALRGPRRGDRPAPRHGHRHADARSRCCASSTSTPRAARSTSSCGLATVVVHTAAGKTTIPALDSGVRRAAARPDRGCSPATADDL